MIPYPVRSYLFIGNKKCRIYAACGVSQTPRQVYTERGDKQQ
ncbi:olfactory receptor 4F15 [Ruminococcus sp. AF41-9]|nr:olfactory receptor 4F15 [Ruminococcus sp. AF41-9]